jgi:exosortase
MEQLEHQSETTPVSSPVVLVATGVVATACVLLFWAFVRRQVTWAVTQQADWGHTLVIPLIAAYFVYLRRAELLARPFRTTWVGLVPVVLGIGIYVLSSIGPPVLVHHNLQGFGAWLAVFGIVLLFAGFRAMTWLWFPLVYILVFGQTISDRFMTVITYPLQDLAAVGAHFALTLLGLDVDRSGNTLYVWHLGEQIPLNIAEACSGMRMLMAFLALGVAMAYTGLERLWQRSLLVLLAVPTAVFVNILRVVTLALLSRYGSDFAAGDFHTFIGLVWLLPAFLIYLGLLWVIRQLVLEDADRAGRGGGRG